MKIANIIYDDELINHTQVDYINYYKGEFNYEDVNGNLPTLYVGWSFMKKCNPHNPIIQNVDILKKRIITNQLYWEFSFIESKSSHVKGVNSFTRKCLDLYYSSKYKYINLDPIFFQISDTLEVLDVLPKKIDACYMYKNDILYILNGYNVWGINLNQYVFFNYDVNHIIEVIIDRTDKFYKDSDGEYYLKYYKLFPEYDRLKRYMVIMLSDDMI